MLFYAIYMLQKFGDIEVGLIPLVASIFLKYEDHREQLKNVMFLQQSCILRVFFEDLTFMINASKSKGFCIMGTKL